MAVKAGKAFLQAMAESPETQEAWERASKRLKEFDRILKEIRSSPEYRKANSLELRLWDEFHAAIREGMRKANNQLEMRNLPSQSGLEDWLKLAEMVDIPAETVGKLTLREIVSYAKKWAEWKIQAEMISGANQSADQSAKTEKQVASQERRVSRKVERRRQHILEYLRSYFVALINGTIHEEYPELANRKLSYAELGRHFNCDRSTIKRDCDENSTLMEWFEKCRDHGKPVVRGRKRRKPKHQVSDRDD
ncbi:MAG: hypothetical protein QGF00_30210 [Planctomycetota bacterium]|jgi:hypothetical protein|nr:hypothetical protein [Planctomycetota bacterium]MDP7253914.1 hypothetical protein [Planctomycetota bacterium]